MCNRAIAACLALVAWTATAAAQRAASPAELKQADNDIPQLAEALELKPGMTVADVGAGFGAMTIVLSRWLGPAGRIYATDIAALQLAALRDALTRKGLDNVVVLEGGERTTNLPDACCDAIFMRDVYHHLTRPEEFNRSVAAALKPGGRFAVIDFDPAPGSMLPDGVPANRGGHGIPPAIVVSEVSAQGLTELKTFSRWPPVGDSSRFFLVLFRKP
jgi:predicted methyltransferase